MCLEVPGRSPHWINNLTWTMCLQNCCSCQMSPTKLCRHTHSSAVAGLAASLVSSSGSSDRHSNCQRVSKHSWTSGNWHIAPLNWVTRGMKIIQSQGLPIAKLEPFHQILSTCNDYTGSLYTLGPKKHLYSTLKSEEIYASTLLGAMWQDRRQQPLGFPCLPVLKHQWTNEPIKQKHSKGI